MASQAVNLNKQVFEKRQYDRTINTSFTQLGQSTLVDTGSALPSVDQFFDYYNQLFFDIPKFGVINSHEYLIKTSQDYIGASNVVNDEITDLIEEITQLRQENLELNQQLISVQTNAITASISI